MWVYYIYSEILNFFSEDFQNVNKFSRVNVLGTSNLNTVKLINGPSYSTNTTKHFNIREFKIFTVKNRAQHKTHLIQKISTEVETIKFKSTTVFTVYYLSLNFKIL